MRNSTLKGVIKLDSKTIATELSTAGLEVQGKKVKGATGKVGTEKFSFDYVYPAVTDCPELTAQLRRISKMDARNEMAASLRPAKEGSTRKVEEDNTEDVEL